ncbi:type II toxin-antitoxin system RelE/ParE family toxin [Pseudoalteromonas sp. MMG012]|uniref:type II toxin-antitoxin system RelE/ParE family toxin n=1 Tax=Pseudoalteromonas sp. MMG012 TaxID=2822686 RepID=UPI001B3A1DBA|nr:type II toxin-antitoxin system RelE/ParE family toxin [Pseudoalteromonas sp. MMG012]MBQ4850730.1 type II toxin-antitoxin system RelE/ParE family toxin [Pseudoalteromonas sp. MMG012]
MVKVLLTRKAKTDLELVECFIAEDNPARARARSFCEEFLHSAVENLATFPCSHPLYNKEKNVRRFVYRDYNLYYQYDTSKDSVYILHILHASVFQNMLLRNSK